MATHFLTQNIPDDPNLVLGLLQTQMQMQMQMQAAESSKKSSSSSPFFNFMKIRRKEMDDQGFTLHGWEEVKEIVGQEWIRMSKEQKEAFRGGTHR